jgi:hypothetical protein
MINEIKGLGTFLNGNRREKCLRERMKYKSFFLT